MYWSNYHSHNFFCDGKSPMEDFVKFAIKNNVKSYGFSSHAPLPFFTTWSMIASKFPNYLAEFNRLKTFYSEQIQLYCGLEVDYVENCYNVKSDFFQNKKFDYLIGSLHYTDLMPCGNYMCIDGRFEDFDKAMKINYDKDLKLAVRRFYEITSLMIENGGFDIVGHIDKIAFNSSNYADFDPSEKWYENLIGDTLQKVKDKGLMLEINTKSVVTKGITYPNQRFFPLINDLKIPIVVNSDCHYPYKMIHGFKQTYKALKIAGFKTVQQLVGSEWQATKFNENGLITYKEPYLQKNILLQS